MTEHATNTDTETLTAQQWWSTFNHNTPEAFWDVATWAKGSWSPGSLDVADRKRIALAIFGAVLADPNMMVIRTAIPLTAEAVRNVGQAIEDAALEHLGRDIGTIHRDDIARAAIWATLDALRAAFPGHEEETK